MTDFSGATIGERIALYRRVNGLTRDELSEATGGTVGRDVIANIENGRRKDISVSQLVAISTALGVPPTALMFDITRPLAEVDGPEGIVSRSVSSGRESVEKRKPNLNDALAWYAFDWSARGSEETPSGAMVMRQTESWRKYLSKLSSLYRRMHKYKTMKDFESEADKKTRIEIGIEIVEAWSAYREATHGAGISGLEEPIVPEHIADLFLKEWTVHHLPDVTPPFNVDG